MVLFPYLFPSSEKQSYHLVECRTTGINSLLFFKCFLFSNFFHQVKTPTSIIVLESSSKNIIMTSWRLIKTYTKNTNLIRRRCKVLIRKNILVTKQSEINFWCFQTIINSFITHFLSFISIEEIFEHKIIFVNNSFINFLIFILIGNKTQIPKKCKTPINSFITYFESLIKFRSNLYWKFFYTFLSLITLRNKLWKTCITVGSLITHFLGLIRK